MWDHLGVFQYPWQRIAPVSHGVNSTELWFRWCFSTHSTPRATGTLCLLCDSCCGSGCFYSHLLTIQTLLCLFVCSWISHLPLSLSTWVSVCDDYKVKKKTQFIELFMIYPVSLSPTLGSDTFPMVAPYDVYILLMDAPTWCCLCTWLCINLACFSPGSSHCLDELITEGQLLGVKTAMWSLICLSGSLLTWQSFTNCCQSSLCCRTSLIGAAVSPILKVWFYIVLL